MSASLNQVNLIGRLGADPEVRTLPSGDLACNLRIATDQSYTDKKSGNKVERTEWHRGVAFGDTAKIMRDHLSKGRLIFATGENRTRKWTDSKGVDRWTTEVVIMRFQFLDSPKKADAAEASAEPVTDPEVPY